MALTPSLSLLPVVFTTWEALCFSFAIDRGVRCACCVGLGPRHYVFKRKVANEIGDGRSGLEEEDTERVKNPS